MQLFHYLQIPKYSIGSSCRQIKKNNVNSTKGYLNSVGKFVSGILQGILRIYLVMKLFM